MKFFNLDCHIGVRDFAQICNELGHDIRLENLSDHTSLCSMEKTKIFAKYKHIWKDINPEMCDNFYKEYKNELSDISCFYCFYPPAFSLLYEKFDKPIIIHFPIRFETPFEKDEKRLDWLISYIERGVDNKQIFLCANNMVDKMHIEKTFDREVLYIPSYCGYDNTSCAFENEKIIFDNNRAILNIESDLLYSFQKKYTLDEFYKFSGCVMIPYHNSLMSLFERYASNMPLFLPSYKLMLDMWAINPYLMLQEISWFKISKSYPKLVSGELDPNLFLDRKSTEFNFLLCDWLDKEWMANIIHFDSVDHLKILIKETDKIAISQKMKEENIIRKSTILSRWQSLFNKI